MDHHDIHVASWALKAPMMGSGRCSSWETSDPGIRSKASAAHRGIRGIAHVASVDLYNVAVDRLQFEIAAFAICWAKRYIFLSCPALCGMSALTGLHLGSVDDSGNISRTNMLHQSMNILGLLKKGDPKHLRNVWFRDATSGYAGILHFLVKTISIYIYMFSIDYIPSVDDSNTICQTITVFRGSTTWFTTLELIKPC
jgi:hypothetical protein